MRDFKFRAWDNLDKRWLNGACCRYISMDTEHKVTIANAEVIFWNQYTGLKDKNDIEIYEGDIIEYMSGQLNHIPTRREVKWKPTEARFFLWV